MLFGGVVPPSEQAACSATSTTSGPVLPRKCRPGRAAEAELVDLVRPCVAVRVDVDLVLRVRRERVVVRAGRGILTRDPVRDDRHGVRLVRAPKRVQVRVVGARIFSDQRRLTMTRSGTGARARCRRLPQQLRRMRRRPGRRYASAAFFIFPRSSVVGLRRLFGRDGGPVRLTFQSEPIGASGESGSC